jgi:hypothetical protein
MRFALAAMLMASVAQLFVVSAEASPDSYRLSGKAYSVRSGDPTSGVTLVAYVVISQGQELISKSVAQDTTGDNGLFALVVSKTVPLVDVRISVIPQDLCGDVRLVGVVGVGVATSYARRGLTPTFEPTLPPPEATPRDVAQTFEIWGWTDTADPCGWRLGSTDLFKEREAE